MSTFYDVNLVKGTINGKLYQPYNLGNKLLFAKVRPDAIIPSKNNEDAGYDIYANFEANYLVIEPHATRAIPTGIATAMSNNYYLQIEERGSTGSIGMKYGAGVIDSSYRGELFIPITNTNKNRLIIYKGDKDEAINRYNFNRTDILYPYSKAICQAIVHIVPKMDSMEISYEELKAIPSKRGTGALGSSGK